MDEDWMYDYQRYTFMGETVYCSLMAESDATYKKYLLLT